LDPSETSAAFEGGLHFADKGKLVCSGYLPPGKNTDARVNVACWDTQTGATIAQNNNVGLYLSSIEGAGGALLAITDYKTTVHRGKFWEFWDIDGVGHAPYRRLLWNIRTGKEIASWGRFSMDELVQQDLWGPDLQRARKISTTFVLSVSPTGKYLAEGGSGSVVAYAVEP